MEEIKECKFCKAEMKWIAGGKATFEFDTDYMKARCENCKAEFTTKKIWTTELSRAKNKNVSERSQEDHLLIIKIDYNGSMRDYLLSFGAFKE